MLVVVCEFVEVVKLVVGCDGGLVVVDFGDVWVLVDVAVERHYGGVEQVSEVDDSGDVVEGQFDDVLLVVESVVVAVVACDEP